MLIIANTIWVFSYKTETILRTLPDISFNPHKNPIKKYGYYPHIKKEVWEIKPLSQGHTSSGKAKLGIGLI